MTSYRIDSIANNFADFEAKKRVSVCVLFVWVSAFKRLQFNKSEFEYGDCVNDSLFVEKSRWRSVKSVS